MSKKKLTCQVKVEPEVFTWLKETSKDSGCSMSHLVTVAIRTYCQHVITINQLERDRQVELTRLQTEELVRNGALQ